MALDEHFGFLRLGQFYLRPIVQRNRLGTRVLRQVLQDVDSKGLEVRLEYLKCNPAGRGTLLLGSPRDVRSSTLEPACSCNRTQYRSTMRPSMYLLPPAARRRPNIATVAFATALALGSVAPPALPFGAPAITLTQQGAGEPPNSPASVTWQHQGSHSYEAERPGLGVSDRYVSPIGWADVYVYGLKRDDWRTGIDDPQFGAHFNMTVDEVKHYGRVGAYADLQIGLVHDVPVAGQMFRTISFRFVRDGRPMASATYLTGRGGKLLKYRISIDANAPHDLDAIARHFIESHLRSVEPADTVRGKGTTI